MKHAPHIPALRPRFGTLTCACGQSFGQATTAAVALHALKTGRPVTIECLRCGRLIRVGATPRG